MIKIKEILAEKTIRSVLCAIVVVLCIKAFVVQTYQVPSGSMLNTLLIGDYMLANRYVFGVKIPIINKTIIQGKAPEYGEILVFTPPNDPKITYVKRVEGLAGDTIEIRDKKFFRNGKLIEEPYTIHSDDKILPAKESPRDNFGPIVVPDGTFFAMGDNRDESMDSRYWGFAEIPKIQGRPMFIYWSKGEKLFSFRWDRIGRKIQ